MLMRHAKSSWKHPGRTDHDRPLNGRGKRTADAMGRWLQQITRPPELIVSSTARRAHKTARRLARQLDSVPEIRLDERLYAAEVDDCMDVLHDIPNSRQHVMLVGHNPTIEDLLTELTGCREVLPTATIAVLEFHSEWGRLMPDQSAGLVAVWRPSEVLCSRGDIPQESTGDGATIPFGEE